MKTTALLMFTLLCSPLLKAGETQDDADLYSLSLEELIRVTISVASKRSENPEDAPGVVSVITRDDIRNYGFRTLEDALNIIPGFTTTRSADRFAAGRSLIVRGSDSDFGQTVLFLVNGHQANDVMTGAGLQFTPDYVLEDVKQIEVIRGPGSTLYGANAFLAVVNIVTDGRGFKNQNIVEAKAGDNQGRSATVKIERVINEDFQFAISGQFYNYEGDDMRIPDITIEDTLGNFNTYSGHVLRDTLEMKDIMLRAAYKNFLLYVNYKQYESDNIDAIGWAADGTLTDSLGIDHTGVYRSGNYLSGDPDHTNVSLNYAAGLSDTLQIDATATWDKYESSTQYPMTQVFIRVPLGITGDAIDKDSGFNNRFKSHTVNFDTFIEWTGHENHIVTLGGSVNRSSGKGETQVTFADSDADGVVETYVPDAPYFDDPAKKVRRSSSFYLQDVWHFTSQFTLTAGIRFDDFNDFGSTTNQKLALLYKPAHKWAVKAMYGTAFRAPGFIEAYTETPPVIISNPNIGPEELDSYELQVVFTPSSKLMLSTNLYQHDINDVIRQVPTTDNPNVRSYQNTGERKLTGIELEGRGQLMPSTHAFINYTHVIDAKDEGNVDDDLNGDIESIPEDVLNFGITIQPSQMTGWSFGLTGQRRWNFVRSSVDDVFPGAGDLSLDDYFIADLNIIKKNVMGVRGMGASLLIHNLSDDTKNTTKNLAFRPRGVPRDGRQILLGLRYQF